MLVIGLTGSIGMGKTPAAAACRAEGIPVCDADAEVHKLYAAGGAAVAPIEAAFPGTAGNAGIDRQKLAAQLIADPTGFKRLEQIVHPLVRAVERAFLLEAQANHAWGAVLEVPLLFETGGDKAVDATIVVSAPAHMQRQRVLSRPGMTEDKLTQILSRQWPDEKKRAAATYVVDTGGTLQHTAEQIAIVLRKLKTGILTPSAFARHWR